jgi:hypothetical protein
MEEGVEVEGKAGAIYKLAKLNQLTERKFAADVLLRGLYPLIVAGVRGVKELSDEVNLVDRFPKTKKLLNPERPPQLPKLKQDTLGAVALIAASFIGSKEFAGAVHKGGFRELFPA